LYIPNNDDLQKGLTITDDIAINPILDFNSHRDAIVKIIKFIIKIYNRIFGDWVDWKDNTNGIHRQDIKR
jgi:hypothetical protein